MGLHQGAAFDPDSLRVGADLRRLGIEPGRQGWRLVRRGVWLEAPHWDALTVDQRYVAFVHATLRSCRDPDEVVLAAHSAAAIWGLPTVEPWPRHVWVHDADRRLGPSRHIRPRPGLPTEPVAVGGVLVTPVARTVIDLACTSTLETALASADHALRERLCTRADLAAEAGRLPPRVTGRGRASLVVDLADELSGSAGESVSRLQMFRANLPRPVLQRGYSDEQGLIGYADFDWPGLLGEFDGKIKYRVQQGASPEEAGEVVWAEKQREDRLRRYKPVARWTWTTARAPGALARHLMGHGLRPLPRSTWLDPAPGRGGGAG